MKAVVALAAGWIAFVALDTIVYGGVHTDVAAEAMGTLIAKFIA